MSSGRCADSNTRSRPRGDTGYHGCIYVTRTSTPPGGGRIDFVSLRDGNFKIYGMFADGSGAANPMDNPSNDLFPALSPDGRKIGFVTGRGGKFEISVMTADGSGAVNITNNPEHDWNPAWSPR